MNPTVLGKILVKLLPRPLTTRELARMLSIDETYIRNVICRNKTYIVDGIDRRFTGNSPALRKLTPAGCRMARAIMRHTREAVTQ